MRLVSDDRGWAGFSQSGTVSGADNIGLPTVNFRAMETRVDNLGFK